MENLFFKKNVLVTGGSGMIGRQLVSLLIEKGANVFVSDIIENKFLPQEVTFLKADLREYSQCIEICKNQNFVFNLVGVKASPKVCSEKPASIMGSMLQYNTNMIEAAVKSNVEWFLYTSSIGVYNPTNILKEDDMNKTSPSKNDWYGGWAKRMGEMLIEAYAKENKINNFSIIRPSNVFGPNDNFDLNSSMVIPSLIRKADENESLYVWGDGSQVRDFIYAKDVARGMLFAVENKITEPLNMGSGTQIKIKTIAEIIANYFNKKIIWDIEKPTGDPVRLLDMSRAKSFGFTHSYSIENAIIETIDWYLNNKQSINTNYKII